MDTRAPWNEAISGEGNNDSFDSRFKLNNEEIKGIIGPFVRDYVKVVKD